MRFEEPQAKSFTQSLKYDPVSKMEAADILGWDFVIIIYLADNQAEEG